MRFIGFLVVTFATVHFIALVRLAILALKIGCLARVDRISTSPSKIFLFTLAASIDLMASAIKMTLEVSLYFRNLIEPLLVFGEIPFMVAKGILAVVCLAHAKRQSALVIIAAGLFLDIASSMTLLWYGVFSGHNPTLEAIAAALVFFGLGRLNREERLQSLASFSRIPLWQEVQGTALAAKGTHDEL